MHKLSIFASASVTQCAAYSKLVLHLLLRCLATTLGRSTDYEAAGYILAALGDGSVHADKAAIFDHAALPTASWVDEISVQHAAILNGY